MQSPPYVYNSIILSQSHVNICLSKYSRLDLNQQEISLTSTSTMRVYQISPREQNLSVCALLIRFQVSVEPGSFPGDKSKV